MNKDKTITIEPEPQTTPAAEAPPVAPVEQRKLVSIAKMGPQVFRMEWTNESGATQINHCHRPTLEALIHDFEDLPPGLPEEDCRHRENLVAESRFKLAQLPDENWEGKDIQAFAKRAGIEISKDIHDLPALLAAIYN